MVIIGLIISLISMYLMEHPSNIIKASGIIVFGLGIVIIIKGRNRIKRGKSDQ